MSAPERLGLFGGSFDPPHLGHLLAAVGALEALHLDRLVLIPAGRQPLKEGVTMSSGPQRLAMCRLLAACHPLLDVDPVEVDRTGLSFSVDTVRAYRAARPAAELFFLVGEDTAATLPQWRELQALAALARIVVLTRGSGELRAEAGVPVERIPSRRVDISATEIRARVRAGRPVRGFVPDAVAAYIAEQGLYGPTTG